MKLIIVAVVSFLVGVLGRPTPVPVPIVADPVFEARWAKVLQHLDTLDTEGQKAWLEQMRRRQAEK